MQDLRVPPTSAWRTWPAGYGTRLSRNQWLPARHLVVMALLIVKVVVNAHARRNPSRLLVTLPPRHGKSELCSHYTPTWFLDLWPDRKVMLTTYGAEFAEEWGLKVKDTIIENEDQLRVRLRSDVKARRRWLTTVGGGMFAAGVGGSLTGRGAHLLGIDDPHKNWAEAHSIVYRDKVWDWWLSTARTRLEPGASVIVPMTRWHEDDFAGRLLKHEPDKWLHLRLPAIAEAGDPLGRRVGEALWPARYDEAALQEIRSGSELVFQGMYQQNPAPPAGSIFQRRWWRWYQALPDPQTIEQWLVSWDCTFKDKGDSDYVVGQVWLRAGADKYLIDQVRAQMDYPTFKRAVRELARKWPQARTTIVEESANGPAVIADLRNVVSGLIGFSPRDSKIARANATSGDVAAGNVWLPDPDVWGDQHYGLDLNNDTKTVVGAAWAREDFVGELAFFPNGLNDDQVDAFTQAMLHMGVTSPILVSRTYKDARLGARR